MTHSEVNPSKCEINATVSAKCYYTRGGDRSEWIADSGSNRFVTNDRKDFVFGSEKEIKERVKVGGGVVTVSVSGTVDLLDLSTLEMISLSNTNYMPDCGRKLLSEGRMDMAGYAINKKDGVCKIISPSGQVISQAHLDDEILYPFSNFVVVSNLSDEEISQLIRKCSLTSSTGTVKPTKSGSYCSFALSNSHPESEAEKVFLSRKEQNGKENVCLKRENFEAQR